MPESMIAQVLLEQLQQKLRQPLPDSPIELAVRAAIELDREQRAWALVALAARLRTDAHYELAITVVDAAIAVDASAEATRAAYTCAVAIHADKGDFKTARKVGDGVLSEGSDEYILRVMARVYWALWQETRLEEYRDRWSRIGKDLEAFGAAA